MWFPKPHQIQGAKEIAAALLVYKWHYLCWEERVGKSLAALHGMHQAGLKNVLIITKKGENSKVLKGWQEAIRECGIDECQFTLTNYHGLGTATKNGRGKIVKLKLKFNPDDYDGVILDESHTYISGYPKPGSMYHIVRAIIGAKPVVFLSATPYAQGFQLLFHQLKVCQYTPWASTPTFYQWHNRYGIPDLQYIGAGQQRETYKVFKDEELLPYLEDHLSYLTRADVGIEHEPKDVKHYIELDAQTKQWFNDVVKKKVVNLPDYQVVCDSPGKQRATLHMLEGGVFIERTMKENRAGDMVEKLIYKTLPNTEKIDYVKSKWGDTEDMVIMYNYKAERIKLVAAFENALVVQATSNAEGVDYSMYEHLIVYSQDWSTARHSQRRARQANMKRKTPIDVHYLLVKDALSEQCYNTVSENKKNFIDAAYERRLL